MTAELLTIDAFSDKVGQEFLIEDPDGPALALTLIEAVALTNHGNAPRVPFSLLFTSKGTAALEQRTYRLRHAVWGSHEIFLVPIGQKEDVVTYQSIFN
jgi:Domain of unknown function (DUF6916)